MRKPKGTAAAVLHFLKVNPQLNHKQIATRLNVTVRRVQQVTHEFGGRMIAEEYNYSIPPSK